MINVYFYSVVEKLVFDKSGLITAVVMDYKDNTLLMVAYMNLEAFVKTCKKKEVYFYSRKRAMLWKKGETSGNILEVKEIYIDCDMDCIQLKVCVKGDGKVCHTGERSCFYRALELNEKKNS